MSSKPAVIKAKRLTKADKFKADREAEKAISRANTEAIWARLNAHKESKAREEEANREAERVAMEAKLDAYDARFAQLPPAQRRQIETSAERIRWNATLADDLYVRWHIENAELRAKVRGAIPEKTEEKEPEI